MSILLTIFITTFISGVVGTGLGGLIGALFKKNSDKTVSLLLSFAGGVMTSIVCFDLLQNAIFPTTNMEVNIFIVIAGLLLGYFIVYFLNYYIDKKTEKEVNKPFNHPKTADDLDELIHADHYQVHKNNNDSKSALFTAGIIMVCAIALHNIPEGMTIGASASIANDALTGSALVMAVLIGLHNIPEGMAISVPLISGGMSKMKAVFLTALSGFPTVLGAFIGYAIGDVGPIGLSLSLSFASGAMLYVVYGEIIPQALLMHRSKAPTFAIIMGLIVGLLIIYI